MTAIEEVKPLDNNVTEIEIVVLYKVSFYASYATFHTFKFLANA